MAGRSTRSLDSTRTIGVIHFVLMNERPNWYRWAVRIILVGVAIGTIAFAAVAWFNEPPFAAILFYVGITVAGFGVLIGTIGVLMTAQGKGR